MNPMRIVKTALLAGCIAAAGMIGPSLHAQNFTFTTIAGGAQGSLDGLDFDAQFYNPTGVAVDNAGNLYVADQNNNLIRQISPLGTNWAVTTLAGDGLGSRDGTNTSAQFSGPTGIAVDKFGSLYVADQYNNIIRRMILSGTNWVVSTIAGTAGAAGSKDGTNASARFSNPSGVAVDGGGNIFVADEANNSIRKITPAGTNWIVTTIAGGAPGANDGSNTAAQFFGPSGVAVDIGGRVFVADQFNNLIRLITPVGPNWVVTTIAGQSISGFSNGLGADALFDAPLGVAVDTNDNVYVADLFNEAIRKLTPSGTNWEVSTIGGGSQGNSNGTGANASFDFPFGVAVDAYSNVFVADSQNNSIRMGVSIDSPAATGSLEVMIDPSSAISAGAKWQLDGGTSRESGAILPGLVPGSHAISFLAVTGFTTPAVLTVPVTAHQTALATGNYAVAIANAGSLQVTISPSGAVDAGAQWQVDSGDWQTNGGIVAGLSIGAHTLSFNPVSGWTSPSSQTVAIIDGQTTLAAGAYALQTGSLQVTILPAAVATIGAKWQLDGGTFYASGATLSGLLPGSHTLSFNTALGWSTPANQQVTITYGQTATCTGIYISQIAGTGALQVTLLPAGAVAAGAQWQLDSTASMASGASLSSLAAGPHALTFTSVAGWTTPASQIVDEADGQTTLATGTYIQQAGPTGSLQVTIGPTDAVSAGAQWQVDGGAFQASGATLGGLAPGTHTVACKVVPKWIPPVEQLVTIVENQAEAISVAYRAGTDRTKPLVSITNGPLPNAHVTTPLVVFKGKASDNIAVNQVLFQFNHAGYQPTVGTTNWSASLTLAPGPNIFDVKADDASGNVSAVLSRTFYFVVPSTLAVSTQGSGKVTPVLNGKILDVGMPYLLTAAPKAGNLFSNWSGSLDSTNPKLSFLMQSNMVLQANFVPNPFIAQQGVFTGLFSDTNGVARQSAGFFRLALAESGLFSVAIQIDGGGCGATGNFDLTGHAHLIAPRAGQPSLTLDLQLDFSNHLAGDISDGNWNAALAANRAVFNNVNHKAEDFLGQYTMAIAGGGAAPSPAGNGYATISVNSAGVILMAGGLADGTVINQTAAISEDGQWPFYFTLPGGGSVLGWINFSNQPASTLGGALSWIRPAGPSPKVYTAGFTNATSAIGSRYSVAGGNPALTLDDGEAVLSDFPVSTNLTGAVSISDNNALQVAAGAEDLTLTLTASTGLITGTFHFPVTGKVTPVRGVVLQQQAQAQGYWLDSSQSGPFLIQSQ
jgi:hypothetical protein